ncbi:aminoglycoside phosphotransferase family protein [Aquamicrobium terrae]|uniref:Ser/Thr protein kinase RdoA (MazF antagonist) n=1 Tax=Aquamicrobium terrae TaxID=1324945 RepID=A0ABV2N5K0_9HYPH
MSLNDADLDLIARDPALPGLKLALDGDALRARLEGGPLVARYLRYKPGETCTAHFDDGGAGLTLRAVTAERYAIYRGRAAWHRPDVRYFDDLCAVVLPGTLDRRVKAARHLLDREKAPALLAALIGPGNDRLSLLKHKPGRRLVLRVDRDGRPYALLKAVPPGDFEALMLSARRAGAAVLGADPGQGIVVQGWIAGTAADPHHTAPEDFARIGVALAAVHRETADGPPRRHPCFEALEALAWLLPDLASEARALSRGLARGLAEEAANTLCHGDFSADQVILNGSGLRFIDWDRAGPGPAQLDLGSFLARLDADRLLDGLPAARAESLGRAFLRGYGAIDAGLYHAAALAALVCEPFRDRRADWPRACAGLLRLAARLAGGEGALARALDREGMARAIAAAWGRPVTLDPPELLRDRPGRRALIAYRGITSEGAFETYGKLRVKGLDSRTPDLYRRLAAALPGDVGVPDVMGILPEARIWLQARVCGHLLADLLDSPDTAPLRAAGRALARLHGVGLDPIGEVAEWTMRDELTVMRDAFARAAAARPEFGQSLAALDAMLTEQAEALPPGRRNGIHRDFYPDQVIVAPDKTWLLDLDLFAIGDPAIDIANFIAHLREHALRNGLEDKLRAHEDAFLAGYTRIAPLPDAARLDVLIRVSLARHVWISQRVAGRSHVTGRVISLLLA